MEVGEALGFCGFGAARLERCVEALRDVVELVSYLAAAESTLAELLIGGGDRELAGVVLVVVAVGRHGLPLVKVP